MRGGNSCSDENKVHLWLSVVVSVFSVYIIPTFLFYDHSIFTSSPFKRAFLLGYIYIHDTFLKSFFLFFDKYFKSPIFLSHIFYFRPSAAVSNLFAIVFVVYGGGTISSRRSSGARARKNSLRLGPNWKPPSLNTAAAALYKYGISAAKGAGPTLRRTPQAADTIGCHTFVLPLCVNINIFMIKK